MTKGTQKTKGNLKYIAIRPKTYDKLIELGSMRDSFNDVIIEIMEKAGVAGIIPELEENRL
jgi:predicted CopG family antitoxin